MGQSLTLQCEATTVKGITSRVDIVWSSGGMELNRKNSTIAIMMGNSLVYADSYTISHLNTTDDGRVIQCKVVINVSPSVMADNNITLDVIGEYKLYSIYCTYIIVTPLYSYHSYGHHITIWSHTRSYGG